MRYLGLTLISGFLGVIFCVSAFPEDRGVIECAPTLHRVPAWTAPGSFQLFEYLNCGRNVSVTGKEDGYFRIQIGRHAAYVESLYVRMIPIRESLPPRIASPQESWPPLPPSRREAWPPAPPASHAYEPAIPVAEVFLGYSYLNFDTHGFTNSRQNANGWEASLSANLNERFALELDISGHYKNFNYYTGNTPGLPSFVTVAYYREYSYLAGPRFNYGPVFVHALFGGDRLSGSALGTPSAQTGFAGILGGGIRYPLGEPLAFRAGLDYEFSRHNIPSGSGVTENNFRASVGIVLNLGRRIIR